MCSSPLNFSFLFFPTHTHLPNVMKTTLLLASLLLPFAATAAEQSFDFKDPKGVNTARFTLDAPLETITGNASGVSGTLTVDPAKPEATKGSIVIDAKTLSVENAMMKEHMLGKDWLDVATHPTITFTVTGIEGVKQEADTVSATVKGKFSLKGVEKEISVPAKVTLLKDKLGARSGGKMQGDLLVVRTEFTIKRSDYGVNPKAPADKVADEIVINLAIAGASPK
jgi:polyisoprenoid-binding protein YceI